MPLFDVKCRDCAWERDDVYEVSGQPSKCPSCGGETAHVWKASSRANVIADDIPGGFLQENFGHTPEMFYSWSAMRKRAKELGLQPFVRHVGEQGSDKSKHTSKWAGGPWSTAESKAEFESWLARRQRGA